MGSSFSKAASPPPSVLASHLSSHMDRPCNEIIHRHLPCSSWVAQCFLAAVQSSFKLYAPLFLITTILQKKFKPNIHDLLRTIPASMRSSLFMGLNGSIFPALVCIASHSGLRLGRSTLFTSAFISSVIAILVEKPSRRSELSVYMANQAMESLYSMAVSRGLAPSFSGGLDVLYVLSFATLVLFSRHFPEFLPGSAKVLINVFVGEEKKPDIAERYSIRIYSQLRTFLERYAPSLYSKGVDEKSRICKHGGGCKTHCSVGFIKAFLIAVGVRSIFQLPAAFISLGLKQFVFLLPKLLLKLVTGSSLRLAMFFAFMSGGTRGATCFFRWLREVDDILNSFLGGLVGGLSVLFFSNVDFAMYIVSKAAEALFHFSASKGVITPIPHGEVLLYSLATAINFYCSVYEPHNLRESYWQFLIKTSKGLWAHSNLSVLPAREEAGIYDLPRYRVWDAQVTGKLIRKHVSREDFAKYYRDHLSGLVINY